MRWTALRARGGSLLREAGAAGRRALARGRAWAGRHRPTPRQVLAAAIGLTVLVWVLWQRCGITGCPTVERLNSYQPGGATVLLDRSGERFADLAPVRHALVPFDSLPAHVPAAFVAVEDKRFYEHDGVDYRRVGGALLANIRRGGIAQGFSTITMQLAQNVWRDRLPKERKTLTRKVLEVRVAREIEKKFEKEEILELYMNQIYFGEGAYGIEAAARTYFGRGARGLTLAQAATLAALPKSPTLFNPRRFQTRSKGRRDLILSMMAAQGRITPEEAERARSLALGVRREAPRSRSAGREPVAPYFVDRVRRELEDRLGEDLYTAPLRVVTTLDRGAQRAAEQELVAQLRRIESGAYGRFTGARYRRALEAGAAPDYLQGAVVVMEAATGDVLALVGGRDYDHSSYNRAALAVRQPGSAFKPFVFAAALEDGYAPSQKIADTPLRMELDGGEVWEPRNFTGRFQDTVTLRQALVQSINVPTIRLAEATGLDDVARVARRAGIRTPIPELPSVAIGSAGVTPLELTAAYTAFAGMGEAVAPRFVRRVEDADGNVVWEARPERERVFPAAVAYLVTDMLQDAVNRGTGTAVRDVGLRGPVAGKTGTTNEGFDVWFAGYTPELAAAVWLGFDLPRPILEDAAGGMVAAPLWGRIMRRVVSGRTRPEAWPEPESVVEKQVDPATGMVLAEGCLPERGRPVRELFIEGKEPVTICPRGRAEGAGPGTLDRVMAWVRAAWRDTWRWIASHVGKEDAEPEREVQDKYLGAPRLPQAGEVPVPEIEPEDLQVPDFREKPVLPDSILPRPDSAPAAPAPPADTLAPPRDTVRPPPDTTAGPPGR